MRLMSKDEDRVCAHCGAELLDGQDGPYCDDLCTAEATDDLQRDKELLFERMDALQAENNQLKAQLAMVRSKCYSIISEINASREFSQIYIGDPLQHVEDIANEALKATTETVTKWEADKRVEVIRECIRELQQVSLDEQENQEAPVGLWVRINCIEETLEALLPKEQEGR